MTSLVLTDHCKTPGWLLQRFKGYFDPCPSYPDFDGLNIDWQEKNYCNPPYSNKIPWIKKAIEESKKGRLTTMLLPTATDAAWFHDLIVPNFHIEFLRGRLKLDNGKHPKYGSMLVETQKQDYAHYGTNE